MRFVKTLAAAAAACAAVLVWHDAPVHGQIFGSGFISPPRNVPGINRPVRIVRGRFNRDVTLTRDTYWVLRGAVFIGEPGHLMIEPGTTVIGETATRGTLVINAGARIIAAGTAEAPIVFTSDQPVGRRGRGDWGGLVINGRAPLNVPGGVGIGEGATGEYGGTNPEDNSGILRYVRVEYAGIEFSPDNELNGIAFQGVGSGTIVENIQVHFNKDDGIEMFGGNVNIKRVVLTAIGDDSIDWTWGWRGKIQFAVAQQRGDDTDLGIEADNHSVNHNNEPRSAPTIYNMTLVGDPTQEFGPESTSCMRLRVGTAAIIRNFICLGFKQSGIDIRDNAALPLIASGELSVFPGINFMNGTPWGSSPQSVALRNMVGSQVFEMDPLLTDPFNRTAPNWVPVPNSPALQIAAAVPPNDGFFEMALYLGALGPDPTQDWTRGWTNFAQR
jgi:hypothetical protein